MFIKFEKSSSNLKNEFINLEKSSWIFEKTSVDFEERVHRFTIAHLRKIDKKKKEQKKKPIQEPSRRKIPKPGKKSAKPSQNRNG